MKLIIGLGNPGDKYKDTRHNVGCLVLDKLKQEISNQFPNFQINKKLKAQVCKVGDIILAKPTTFMNDSGKAVRLLTNFYHLVPSALYVVHDDLDIALGQYKIQLGVGPKVHNGITSIDEALKTKKYWRVRVGIENRDKITNDKWPMTNVSGEEYVLQEFTKEEFEILSVTIEKILGDIIRKAGIHE